MDDGRVVAVAYQLANARGRHLGVLLREVHGYLPRQHIVALAAAAENVLCGHVEVGAHLLENVVDGERPVVYLHRALYHPLGQTHVDVAVIHHRVGQERVDHALKVAHAAVGRRGNEGDYVGRYLQSVAPAL